MKKLFAILLAILVCVSCFAGCGSKESSSIVIAVPNDTTNEARALILLENIGLIKLKEGVGITATVLDIEENPYNIEFKEVEAAQVPSVLQDVDFAVINSNYALAAGIDPAKEALALEGSYSAYSNILVVREGNEDADLTKALIAALESQAVADYITNTYSGAVVSTVDNPTNGIDPTVDYEALKGTKVTIAATPTPHCEILEIVKPILADLGIELEIAEYNDYVVPNKIVDDGTVYANYFQHLPYLEDFNANNGTKLVSVSAIHVEPMGIYGGKTSSLDDILKK